MNITICYVIFCAWNHSDVGLDTGLNTVCEAWCEVCGPLSSSEVTISILGDVGDVGSRGLHGDIGDTCSDEGQLSSEGTSSSGDTEPVSNGGTSLCVPEGPAWSSCITVS